jgi:uncharacterized protein (TIGR03437 family)
MRILLTTHLVLLAGVYLNSSFPVIAQSAKPAVSSVANAASYSSGAISPGEMIVIFGTNLGPSEIANSQMDSEGRITKSLSGVQVLFDGDPAPLIYVASRQLCAMVPLGVAGKNSTRIQVINGDIGSEPIDVTVAGAAPGVFSSDASGKGQATAFNQDGSSNSSANPAQPGSIVTLYLTGAGLTDSADPDGTIASAAANAILPFTARISGRPAEVQYLGSAPGNVTGFGQANIAIPADLPYGGDLPLLIQVGDGTTQQAITLAVAGSPPPQPGSPTASPARLTIRQVNLGPVAPPQKITVSSSWNASVTTDSPWLTMSRATGSQTTPLVLDFVGWRAASMNAGTYSANICLSSTDLESALDIPVTYEVVPMRPEPAVTTIFPAPNNCIKQPGYIDENLCVPAPDNFAVQKGTTYVDSTFGGKVRIMTDKNVYHAYSSPNPLSANNKYLLLLKDSGAWDIALVSDGSVIASNVKANQSVFWDARDDETYYYLTGAQIISHSVSANADTVLIDYGNAMTSLSRGGTGDSSADNWISFWSPNEKKVCAVNLNTKETYCADYSTAPGLAIPKIDFTLIAKGVDRPTGKRYVIVNGAPSNIVYSVNLATGKLDFEYRGPEQPEGSRNNHDGVCDPGERCWFGSHTDTFQDAQGIQYMVFDDYTSDPCEFAINTVQLNKGPDLWKQMEIGGGRKKVFTLWKCGPGWYDEHVACAKKASACVISTQSSPRSSTDTSPIVNTAHDNEILMMIGNGDEIRRVTKTHTIKYSDRGDLNYWGIPRAAISNDGTLITFDSNYGDPSGARVSIVSTTK